MVWVGDDNDFINSIAGTDISIPLKDDTYLIMVGDTCVLFNRRELTEESANVIKKELGITRDDIWNNKDEWINTVGNWMLQGGES